MKFDYILGNPPYQESTGGSGVQAVPVYNYFVQEVKKLDPKGIVLITPSRWFSGGFGLDSFRDEMLHDRSIKAIHDFPEASDCFSGVQIKGGVSYFVWDAEYDGDCTIYTHRGNDVSKPETRPLLEPGCDVFIRYNEAVDILHKIWDIDGKDNTMDAFVSSQKPFGLSTKFNGNMTPNGLDEDELIVYGNKGKSYVSREEVSKSQEMIDCYKVFIPAAGSGSDSFPHSILGRPFFGDKGTVCTETYVAIGPYASKDECFNVMTYISTRFFRFLVMLRKPTQHALKKVYAFVPVQDFSKPWTDAELYAKYGLTDEEIAFIDSMIKPMDLSSDKEMN